MNHPLSRHTQWVFYFTHLSSTSASKVFSLTLNTGMSETPSFNGMSTICDLSTWEAINPSLTYTIIQECESCVAQKMTIEDIKKVTIEYGSVPMASGLANHLCSCDSNSVVVLSYQGDTNWDHAGFLTSVVFEPSMIQIRSSNPADDNDVSFAIF